MKSGLSPLQRIGKHPLSRNGREDRPTDGLTARMNGSIQAGSETRMYKNPWRRERATIVVLFSSVIELKSGELFLLFVVYGSWLADSSYTFQFRVRVEQVGKFRLRANFKCRNGSSTVSAQVHPSGGTLRRGGETAPHRRPHPDEV